MSINMQIDFDKKEVQQMINQSMSAEEIVEHANIIISF